MLFNSHLFLFFFLPVTFAGYFLFNRWRLVQAATGWLLLASLVFYGWWKPLFVALIGGSILFNYVIGTALTRRTGMGHDRDRRLLLFFGIAGNLALLSYFKYFDFFASNMNRLGPIEIPLVHVALPLGISFFTFTQLAYLVDARSGRAGPYRLRDYALYVSFFPTILSGPICYHREVIPQLTEIRKKILDYRNIAGGVYLLFIGLFKKVVAADTLGRWADNGFDTTVALNLVEAWTTSLSYTFQLYFDFSGYTDMALGAALMLNIKLPANFDSPYKSTDIQEFWRRWHITLGRFMRDYVYIPLGGSRCSEIRVLGNLMLVFFTIGLWHGAGWTFVVWGCLHGAAMILLRLWRKLNVALPKPFAWFLTFNFVNVAWVFFRARSFSDALKILKGMLGISTAGLPAVHGNSWLDPGSIYTFISESLSQLGGEPRTAAGILLALLVVTLFKNSNEMLAAFRPTMVRLAFLSLIALSAILCLGGRSEFLYFRF
jgi:alginate O-acetyltransferase complex protein AlgI